MLYNRNWGFKAAQELHLTKRQYQALTNTIAYLEGDTTKISKPFKFDMNIWRFDDPQCGTACCIGGTAEFLAGWRTQHSKSLFDLSDDGLRELFFPSVSKALSATSMQAAQALRNYLTTGKPSWATIMGKGKKR